MDTKKITAEDIKAALSIKYYEPKFAFFTEVASGTGLMSGRYADAISYALWPSDLFEMSGFEIKVSRGDFMNEIADPSKSEAIKRYCDRWWLVTPPNLVDKSEVPADWGLMELRGGRLYRRKPAPKLETTEFTPQFVAALLRRATEGKVERACLHEMVRSELESRDDSHIQRADRDKEYAEKELRRYRERVEAFEETSGLTIVDGWDGVDGKRKLGEAVRFVLGGGLGSTVKAISEVSAILKNHSSSLDEAQKAVEDWNDGLPNFR